MASPLSRFDPLRLFVVDDLKSRVYVHRSRTLQDLKVNICAEIGNIPADTLVRVMANTRNRYMQCMDNGGRHLPDMIFKTVGNKTLNMYYHYETKLKPF